MKDKKQKTEEFDQWDAWAQATYRTGSTRPPKSRGGLIAFLLVLVIFLCGISTALGLMNIRLFQKLSVMEATQPSPVAFSRGGSMDTPNAVEFPLGFAGQEVPSFWQKYHDLPPGIYVVEVTNPSEFQTQGLLPGDIVTRLDNIPVLDAQTFLALLETYQPGDQITATIYRGHNEYTITLTMEE